jgi:hypothetical protein
MATPTLVLTGDEDWPCLQPAPDEADHSYGGAIGDAKLRAHHQYRGPDQFNRIVGDFIIQVDAGRWPVRDPRAMGVSITGML